MTDFEKTYQNYNPRQAALDETRALLTAAAKAAMADGTLPLEKFRYYMIQDYLYLIDYTIVNERLCRWVGDELELPKLAEELISFTRRLETEGTAKETQ